MYSPSANPSQSLCGVADTAACAVWCSKCTTHIILIADRLTAKSQGTPANPLKRKPGLACGTRLHNYKSRAILIGRAHILASPIGLCRLRVDSHLGLVIECGTEIKGAGRSLAPPNSRQADGMRGDFPAIMKVIICCGCLATKIHEECRYTVYTARTSELASFHGRC